MKPTAKRASGTRREHQKAETRRLILEASKALFEEHGFAGTTMRRVAAKAGVGLGTIFTHFPDKSALLIAALLEDLAATDQEILATLPQEAPLREQIMHIAAAGFGYWCARPALSTVLLREMWFVEGEWASKRREETDRFIEFCHRLLVSAQRRGELRSDINLRLTAESMYSLYVGSIVRAASDNDFDVKHLLSHLETFVDQLLAGISTDPAL